MAERWGERTVNAFADIADRPRTGDVALWRTINDLYAPLIAGCLDAREPPLAPLETAARAKLAAVPDSATLKLMAPTTLNRLSEFGELQDQFLVFMVDVGRRRLRLAGLPRRRGHREGPPAGPGDAGAAHQRLGRQHGDDHRRSRDAGRDRRHPGAAAPGAAAASPPVARPDYSSARHQSAKRRIPSCIVTFGA